MDLVKMAVLVVCGVIAVYVGIRAIVARSIPIVSEGGTKPLAVVSGWSAVLIGVVTCSLGVVILLGAAGVIHIF
jgi:hypothetical protein